MSLENATAEGLDQTIDETSVKNGRCLDNVSAKLIRPDCTAPFLDTIQIIKTIPQVSFFLTVLG